MTQGSVRASILRAARKVSVCQRPTGAKPARRSPFGPQPRIGAMVVLIQVSSMNTSRAGSRWRLARRQRSRRLTTSGRCCSAAKSVFFERSSCAAQEAPDRIVRHRDTPLRQQVLQAVQREMRHLVDLLENESAMRVEAARSMAAELGRCWAARLAHALRPLHDRRRCDAEALGDRSAALAACDRRGDPRAQVIGIRSRHACWPPSSSMHLESELN